MQALGTLAAGRPLRSDLCDSQALTIVVIQLVTVFHFNSFHRLLAMKKSTAKNSSKQQVFGTNDSDEFLLKQHEKALRLRIILRLRVGLTIVSSVENIFHHTVVSFSNHEPAISFLFCAYSNTAISFLFCAY